MKLFIIITPYHHFRLFEVFYIWNMDISFDILLVCVFFCLHTKKNSDLPCIKGQWPCFITYSSRDIQAINCVMCLQDCYAQRRMSDPSQSWNNFLRGSYKKSGIRKSRSEASNVDFIPDGTNEVEATDIEDGMLLSLFMPRFFEPTCAHGRWALMHHLPSVRLSVCLSVRPSVRPSVCD